MAGMTTKAKAPTQRELTNRLEGLLDALEQQCFPTGSLTSKRGARRCDYSMNVVDAMHAAYRVLGKDSYPPADDRDLARIDL